MLGLSELYDMEGVCLMGETSGYFVDPHSAQAVLEILTKVLGLEVDFAELEVKAKQIDQITSKIKELEGQVKDKGPREDLNYIV